MKMFAASSLKNIQFELIVSNVIKPQTRYKIDLTIQYIFFILYFGALGLFYHFNVIFIITDSFIFFFIINDKRIAT